MSGAPARAPQGIEWADGSCTGAQWQDAVAAALELIGSGAIGELREIDTERNEALIEIAPGTIVRVHRQTLARVVQDEPVLDDAVDETGEADEPRDRA